MKITGGTEKAVALLAKLQQEGHMVDVYSKSFFDLQPSIENDSDAPFNQEGYQYIYDEHENNLDSNEKPIGHLLFINNSALGSELQKTLIEVYEPLGKLINAGKYNPNFLLINLFTEQILCIGLGQNNILFSIDAASGKTINAFNLLDAPQAIEDIDYMDRLIQHDVYECVSDLVHALYNLGLAMYKHENIMVNQEQLEHTLDSGPNELGVYNLKSTEGEILNDEEYSEEQILELLEEITGYQKEQDDSMKMINVFFPNCYQGDLNALDY